MTEPLQEPWRYGTPEEEQMAREAAAIHQASTADIQRITAETERILEAFQEQDTTQSEPPQTVWHGARKGPRILGDGTVFRF